VLSPPLNPRKRSSSTPRKLSFSPPPRMKSRPLSSHGMPPFPHSPMTPSFSTTSGNTRRRSSEMGHQHGQESTPSSNRNLQAPSNGNASLSVPFTSTMNSGRGNVAGRAVRIRHVTFREWIHLPHPPTLLSCLTGKGSAEEDDLRFLIAPSREGAHSMLVKGCFSILRTTSLVPQRLEDRERERTTEGCSEDGTGRGRDWDGADASDHELVSYACRYWAYHCAEMLNSLMATHQHSEIYMSVAPNVGRRWKPIRGEMLEFFTRKLLWWVDTSISLNCVAQVVRGLKRLLDVLEVCYFTQRDSTC
jgi:hypothetical protein